jgi:hypothetical protein
MTHRLADREIAVRLILRGMDHYSRPPVPPIQDEETIPLIVSVAPEHLDTLERWAAWKGMTGIDLLESFVTRAFGPLGARIER